MAAAAASTAKALMPKNANNKRQRTPRRRNTLHPSRLLAANYFGARPSPRVRRRLQIGLSALIIR